MFQVKCASSLKIYLFLFLIFMQFLIKALCQGGHPTSIPKFVGVTRKGTVEVLLFYLCNLYCNLYFFLEN